MKVYDNRLRFFFKGNYFRALFGPNNHGQTQYHTLAATMVYFRTAPGWIH
jgi:hypothetical protein